MTNSTLPIPSYRTDIVSRVEALPELSQSVYLYLLRKGWYNFGSEPGFSDKATFELAGIFKLTPRAVNGVVTRLNEEGLTWTEHYRIGETGFDRPVDIIYNCFDDEDAAEHADLLAYRDWLNACDDAAQTRDARREDGAR